MPNENNFDVMIIGGSYAGLSAAMALGRSLRSVLIIDSGHPCNKQTPHSHNFITQDGQTPKDISEKAKAQVLQYDTVKFYNGFASEGCKTGNRFEIRTRAGDKFFSKKLILATGITDLFPDIPGFAACWGISILHCPYCHGYEVKHHNIGIIGNGDLGFELCRLISNWTKQLTLFTNGRSTLTEEQSNKIKSYKIDIVEKEILHFEHVDGMIRYIIFKDGSRAEREALFTRVDFRQHCDIPVQLGCEITEQGFIKVDDFGRTSVYGLYAAGDNSSMFRAVSIAIASGTKAGAMLNKELIEEAF